VVKPLHDSDLACQLRRGRVHCSCDGHGRKNRSLSIA
jgi:hypothetical protein